MFDRGNNSRRFVRIDVFFTFCGLFMEQPGRRSVHHPFSDYGALVCCVVGMRSESQRLLVYLILIPLCLAFNDLNIE